MSEQKIIPSNLDVETFIAEVENEGKRKDSETLLELIKEVTSEKPVMWGDSIVGFGHYHYKYESGRKGEWFLAGFSPRKQRITIYITAGFDMMEEQLEKLGKYKNSVGCLYINKLADIDLEVLKEMIRKSVETQKKRYADYN